MRTTLTLDPDVVRLIENRIDRDRVSMKRVVNAALRRGLTEQGPGASEPYRMKSYPGQLQSGVDIGSLNRLADELEDAEITRAQAP
ncbi:type II toxin-antitoxin system antitoxin VapB33 [soil metagenome]